MGMDLKQNFDGWWLPRANRCWSRRVSHMVLILALSPLPSVVAQSKLAKSELIVPGKNLEVLGIPPIPASLAREVARYTRSYGLPVMGWNAEKREVWLKDLSSVTTVSRVANPGASPEGSIYISASGIYDLYAQPQGKYLAYTRDANGDESFQLYLYELGNAKTTLLSDGKSRNTEPVWSNDGDRIVYSSTPAGGSGVNLRLLNPFDPKSDHLLAQSSGSYFKAYDWSPDDKHVVYCDFTSNTASTLWLVDVANGGKVLLSPNAAKFELYDFPQFSKDGKGIYVVTDHDSDSRRLAYIDLASRKFSYVPSARHWDVDEFQIAPSGKIVAFTTNEDGISRIHLFDIAAGKERAVGQIPVGIISDLKWRKDSTELAFNFKSLRTPNDVYSVNAETGKVEFWVTNGVDASKVSQPELIHWPTFDKRNISGFLYRPPANFK